VCSADNQETPLREIKIEREREREIKIERERERSLCQYLLIRLHIICASQSSIFYVICIDVKIFFKLIDNVNVKENNKDRIGKQHSGHPQVPFHESHSPFDRGEGP
jgi:hypothetical protein